MTSIKDIIKNITAPVTLIAEEVNNVQPEAVVEEEQIDELSKQTLGNYVVKSSENRATNARQYMTKHDIDSADTLGTLRNIRNRKRGISKAIDKLTKEELDITEARERTPAFRFIHKPGDKGSEKKLADLKANKAPHEVVSMKPRLGKNSPHADLYKKGGELSRNNGHRDIKKQHASHFDVYVHPKHDHPHWTKIRAAEDAERHKQHLVNRSALRKKFHEVAHKVLTKHGYDKVGESTHDTVYAHFNKKTGVHHTATVSNEGVGAAFNTNKATGSIFHANSTANADHHKETMDNLPVKFEAHVLGEHEKHLTGYHSMREDFQINFEEELIEHEEYGLGNIISENDETVEVAFETGIIVLNK